MLTPSKSHRYTYRNTNILPSSLPTHTYTDHHPQTQTACIHAYKQSYMQYDTNIQLQE